MDEAAVSLGSRGPKERCVRGGRDDLFAIRSFPRIHARHDVRHNAELTRVAEKLGRNPRM